MSQTVRTRDDSPFWVLLIEAKNSEIATSAGLAQLLVYAHEALQRQELVWGLVTNGVDYQFVRLVMEGQPRYELLPQLHFIDQQPGAEVLKVLKAIKRDL